MPSARDRADALDYAIDEAQVAPDGFGRLAPPSTVADGFAAFLATQNPATSPAQPTKALGRPEGGKPPSGNPEVFLREYVRTGNDAIEAAKRAGYAEPHIAGPRLLRKPSMKTALQAIRGAALTIHDVSREALTTELWRVAMSRPGEFKHPDGSWKKLEELTEDQHAAIAEVKPTPYGVGYKLHDKLKAAQMMMDILGMGAKTVNVNHGGSIEHRVNLDALPPEDVDRLLGAARRIEAEVLDVATYTDVDDE